MMVEPSLSDWTSLTAENGLQEVTARATLMRRPRSSLTLSGCRRGHLTCPEGVCAAFLLIATCRLWSSMEQITAEAERVMEKAVPTLDATCATIPLCRPALFASVARDVSI